MKDNSKLIPRKFCWTAYVEVGLLGTVTEIVAATIANEDRREVRETSILQV